MRKFGRIFSTAVLATLLLFNISFSADAADDSTYTGWKTSLIVDVTATQTAYSDSWVGGEAGAFNWVGNLNGTAERQLKPWFDLRSTLKLSFGQTMTQDTSKTWSKPRKSTDLIDWDNLGRFTLHKFVDPFVAFRLESQFMDASFEAKKRYLSPLTLTQSAGIARKFYEKDKDLLLSRLGLAVKETFRKGIIDSVNAITEDSTFVDGGIESVTDFTMTFNEKLMVTSKLTLYKAFFFSKKDDVKGTPAEDYWKAVDVNWENIVGASLTKIVSVFFYTKFLYDKQISLKGQFKETIGIGLVLKLR
ncbi:MAG: DUF3078 domain-containing protein [Candidatus Zixiibacteriota bacterium]